MQHQPQPKRGRRRSRPADRSNPLPGCAQLADNCHQFTGHFTGLDVQVANAEHIGQLYANGCFGTGSHTKSAPAVLWQQPEAAAVAAAAGGTPTGETLVLFAEEAFFLHHSLRCLDVRSPNPADGSLSGDQLFEQFRTLKPTFAETYVAYVFLRSLNWVVKAGLKFGGDFCKCFFRSRELS